MAEKKKSNSGTGGPYGSYLVRKQKQKARQDKASDHQKSGGKSKSSKKGK